MVLKKKNILIILLLISTASLFGLNVPALKSRVNDYADIITPEYERQIEDYLYSLENTTQIQMAVLTVKSLEGQDIESFSIDVADAWKLGQNDKDIGALLIVSLDDRTIRIEVGYDLEEKLTALKCGLIIRNIITPEFQTNNYGEGILQGVKNMGGIASDNTELIAKSVLKEDDKAEDSKYSIIIVLIFIFIILFGNIDELRWLFFARLFGSSRSFSSGKTFFSSGSGSSHSFSGGSSFRGGGGHFGGGGATGHW